MLHAKIRAVTPGDAPAIARIYNENVLNSIATFEEIPVSDEVMAYRIAQVSASEFGYFVAEIEDRVAGYAYAAPWKERTAYRFTVEVSVYVDSQFAGQGVGKKLYGALIDTLRVKEVHAALGGVSLPNPASERLHESMGFEKVAHFKQTGFKFGKFIDVGYWQLLL